MVSRGVSKGYRFKEIINLEAPIIAGKSIGGIELQTPFSQLKDYMLSLHRPFHPNKNAFKANVRIGIEVAYTLHEGAIDIVVDILTGQVIEVICQEGYKGKFVNTIGIGSPFHELLKLSDTFDVYNNYYIMSPQFPGLYIELPEGYDDYDGELKDLPNYAIATIGVFSRWRDGEDWYGYFYGESFIT